MTEKRYFERRWEDEYYIFDSQTISEKEFDEKVEYEGYQAFRDSLMGDEVVDRLNELNGENQQLKREYQKLKHRHSLLHDVCLDAECERDSLKKDVESLEKENKELKQELLEIIDASSDNRPNKKGFAGSGRFA